MPMAVAVGRVGRGWGEKGWLRERVADAIYSGAAAIISTRGIVVDEFFSPPSPLLFGQGNADEMDKRSGVDCESM